MRYRYRLVVNMLLVCIPLMVTLAVLLTTRSSTSLTRAAERGGVDVARAVTLHVEDFLSERREDLTLVADQLGTEVDDAETTNYACATRNSTRSVGSTG